MQGIRLVETFNLNLLAYEFAKRKFSEKYGKDIPIWALLASGSTGGVCFLLLRPSMRVMLIEPTDCILAFVLPSWYCDFPSHGLVYIILCRCRQIAYTVTPHSPYWDPRPVHCARIESCLFGIWDVSKFPWSTSL